MPLTTDAPDNPAQKPPADTPEPSQRDPEALLKTLRGWWRHDGAHARKWRDGDEMRLGARAAFDFVAGHGQWTEGELAYLKAQRRAPIVFNRTLPTISSVVGIEINSRHDVVFLPNTPSNTDQRGRAIIKANETLSAANRDMAEECDAEDHQSEAFRDAVCTGMGWTEERVDYDDNPAGQYVERVVNPLEMAWDYRAREKNIADSQRRWHLRCMSMAEAKSMFPDVDPGDLNAVWAASDTEAGKGKVDEYGASEEVEMKDEPSDETDVYILRCQWWEYEKFWLVAHPGSPEKPAEMSLEQFGQFQDQAKAKDAMAAEQGLPAMQYSATRGRRKVFREAYIGRKILGEVKPPQFKNGFTFNCITGIPDRNQGFWFGLPAVMRDPQKWANAWLSQTQHILNSTAKGGIIAEIDAFQDQRQAEQTYALPDAITWANEGAIAKGKIMQKPGAGITAGHANLMEFAVSSIRDVTGINLEILGLRDANQPGILEAQRKQAAMTILAPWFDSLRRFRKMVGRVRLFYIQNYLADGRMIRIAGEDGQMLIPLMKQGVIGDHEIVIDDAPTSPNQKQANWAVLQPLAPLILKAAEGNPMVGLWFLRQSPLPSKAVDELEQLLNKEPSPQQIAHQQLAIAGEKAKVAKDEASADQSRASALQQRTSAVVDIVTAGVTAQQVHSEKIQAVAEALTARKEARMAEDGEEPAIATQSAGPRRQLPMLPMVPPLGNTLPQLQELPTQLPVPTQGQ